MLLRLIAQPAYQVKQQPLQYVISSQPLFFLIQLFVITRQPRFVSVEHQMPLSRITIQDRATTPPSTKKKQKTKQKTQKTKQPTKPTNKKKKSMVVVLSAVLVLLEVVPLQ